MTYNKAVYKYFFKAFYGHTNKKQYKLQILKHNICYTNIIAIQNPILIAKISDKSAKKNSLLLKHLISKSNKYKVQ